MTSGTAFKVLTVQQWAELSATGRFEGAPVDLADGYIHLSTADQLEETIAKHFAGQLPLVIVEVRLESYGDAVKWETSRNGALFPHIYAPLTLASVANHLVRDA